MGLLDDVIGGIGGGSSSPVGGLVTALLNSQGGVQGLIGNFERAGLGGIAQSWVGNGANQPVSPDQLRTALGDGQVQNMAAQSGMAPNDLLSQLSQHLPGIVDRMTPHGTPAATTGWDDASNA